MEYEGRMWTEARVLIFMGWFGFFFFFFGIINLVFST